MKLTSRLILAEDKARKGFQKVTLKMLLLVGEAKNNSILGPLLGQHQLNILSFCNDFNKKSLEIYELGVEIPVFVTLHKDKTYTISMRFPLLSFYLEQICFENEGYKVENLYDILKILSFFLKKEEENVSFILFGYLSSYIFKKKILL